MLKIGHQSQRGLSIVELMVGIAVGLFVVAAASMLTATQLSGNRKLLLEAQVQQDMRAAADIVTKEIRRMGYSLVAHNRVWPNSESTQQQHDLSTPTTSEITFRYTRAAGESGPYGFSYDPSTYTIKSKLAAAGWQELTDPRTLKIISFSITPLPGAETRMACSKRCPDDTTDCWPRHQVLEFRVNMVGEAATDSTVSRSLSTVVRVRNEYLSSVGVSATHPCPL